MRPSWSFVPLLCVSLVLASAASADCPTGTWGGGFTPNTPFSGAFLDGHQNYPGDTSQLYIAEVHVDLVQGSTSAYGSNAGANITGHLGATFADEYTIIGPPSATPLAITAVLEVRGSVSTYTFAQYPSWECWTGSASCSFAEIGLGQSRSWPVQPCLVYLPYVVSSPINEDLSVPLLHPPGEPFVLHFSVEANGGRESASIRTQLRFVGLPQGYSITSCHGFNQLAPVATRHSSWSALKTHYR